MTKRLEQAYWLSVTDWIHYIPPGHTAADQLCATICHQVTLNEKVKLLHCVITWNVQHKEISFEQSMQMSARLAYLTSQIPPHLAPFSEP